MGVNGSGGFRILKRGVPVCELCVRRASGKGGSGGMPPPPGRFLTSGLLRSFLVYSCSEIAKAG